MGNGFWTGFWIVLGITVLCVAFSKDAMNDRAHEEAMSKMGYCKKYDINKYKDPTFMGWEPCPTTAVPIPVKVERP